VQPGVDASGGKHIGHKTSMGKELPHTSAFVGVVTNKKWYINRELQTNARQARLKKNVRQAPLCQISMQPGVEASGGKHIGHKTNMGKIC
jgi:hypothetical protein